MLTSVMMMALVFLGFGSLMVNGLQTYNRASNDVTVTNSNAQNMRRISDALRGAINVAIVNSGTQVNFNFPKLSSTLDPVTNEAELVIPLTSDGTNRSYSVNFNTGKLTDQSGRVLVQNIISTDPQVGSSQYQKAYTPFSYSIIGGQQAVTINLITQTGNGATRSYQRLKTTVYLRS